jgi:hypothetical protein
MAPPEVYTVSNVMVTITGVTDQGTASGDFGALLFNSCTPPDWSIEAPKHVFHGQKGPETLIASVQKPSFGTVTLSGGWDPNMALAKWMGIISDPTQDITKKKLPVKIDFLDSKGEPPPLFTWQTDSGILTSFSHSGSDAGSHAVLTVTATIDADDWSFADGSGNVILASAAASSGGGSTT